MIEFHTRKVKPFIHILSNFHEFLSSPTPSAVAVNWSGSEALSEETQDQLLPHHFENTGSNLFFYVDCSYLVKIKFNLFRICWYKKILQSKHLSPTLVSFSEGNIFQSFPWQRFLTLTFTGVRNRQIHFDWILQHTMCWCQHKYVPKIIKFHKRLP